MTKIIKGTFFILWIIMFLMIFLTMNKILHPIIIMVFMIIFNIISCLNISIWKMNFMYSIIMFLIMISGLLIIFMYFSSLISNEQMKINLNLKMLTLLTLNMMVPFNMILFYNLFIFNKFNFFIFDTNSIKLLFMNKFINLMNLYSYPLNNLTILTIMFLLISFITIIKINSSTYSFSMRKINKYEKNN